MTGEEETDSPLAYYRLGEKHEKLDHYHAAQKAAEEHLEACWAAENGVGPEPEDTLAPFCGCLTCEVREVLHAAYPHLRAAWESDGQ